MSLKQAWFARRFPVGDPRNGMAPVHRRGWMVVGAFAAMMGVGALIFMAAAQFGLIWEGAAAFALFSFLGGAGFIAAAIIKGDTTRTVADYRKQGAGNAAHR